MRIEHDKASGALYVKIRDGEYDHTEAFSERADVYLDVDAEGNVLGLEALSLEDLAEAIEEQGGALEVPDRYVYRSEESAAVQGNAAGIAIDDPDAEVEIPRRPSGSVGDVREQVSESVGDVGEEVSESVEGENTRPARHSDRRANR